MRGNFVFTKAVSLPAMSAVTPQRSDYLQQLSNWLVITLLVVTLGVALATPNPGPDLTADDSFGTTLVLQKKISDDNAYFLDADTSFDAVLASTVHGFGTQHSSISTTFHLAATYLAVVISATPRAPPLLQLT
jgi:hypothetical protein